ncbi:hypothetical protein GWK47_043885 [Chionoecetes opilio]|uniref:Uncharacterized protein n=1 Tax=Chionoecetes opilio TaxID=41210 RepID=A0A8J4YEM4_CHIOP|nr:hypothetical protein GWK47_043885 [Chionoecetes opilio]
MKMRERKTFPRAFSTTPEECMSVAASTVDTASKKGGRRRGGRAIQGQERPFRTTLAAQPLCGQLPETRTGGPGREAQKRERPLEEGLWTVSGPRAKGPRPRAPKPGRPPPDWDDKDPGGHPQGVEHSWTPPSRRKEPRRTLLDPLPGKPPGRDGLGAGVDTRVRLRQAPKKGLAPRAKRAVTACQWQGGPSGGGRRRTHHRRSDKARQTYDREAGRGSVIHGEGGEPLRQLTEEGNRRGQQGGVLPLLKSRRKKTPPSPVAPATGGPWQKTGTPGGNQPSHVESHQRPGTGIGAQDGEGPRFTLVVPALHTSAGSRPAFIQGNRSWPPEKNHLASWLPSTHGNHP